MTGGWTLLAILVLILLVVQWEMFESKHRCWYCNELLGHTDHCPYNNKDIA